MMKFPTEWEVIKFHGSKPPTSNFACKMEETSHILAALSLSLGYPPTTHLGSQVSRQQLGQLWDLQPIKAPISSKSCSHSRHVRDRHRAAAH